jgi:hypothetical protein
MTAIQQAHLDMESEGAKVSARLHLRLRELLLELKLSYPQVRRLIMGNGIWTLRLVESVPVRYSDEDDTSFREDLDLLAHGTGNRLMYAPVGWRECHAKVVDEINEICEDIAHYDYLQPSDISV